MKSLTLTIPMILSFTFMTTYNSTMNKPTVISWHLNPDMNMNPQISLISDWMSSPFAVTIIMISSTLFIYSLSYIDKKNQKSFFIVLVLFIASMIILIFTDNIIMLILGWDGLGLTSYLLVMHYQNPYSLASSNITLLSNRIGDMTIITAIAITSSTNVFSFPYSSMFNTTTMILLMTAAISKSAQMPLSAWLPAAMAAPTPISALVHSSTLVTAGAFIMIRLINHPTVTSYTFMLIACTTALCAGLAANWEQDMKKIIALSTLSQIAMISFIASIGQPTTAFFHMNTHALFKSTLFLSAGYLIHKTSYQDSRAISAQTSSTPSINNAIIITSMALMGLPFLSGFYSKDAIMENMMMSSTNMTIMMSMFLAVGLTASYSTRMMKMILNQSQKTQPFSPNHYSNFMKLPIMMILPFSISSGTIMMWLSNPHSTIVISPLFKMMTLSLVTLGILLGLFMNFKSKQFTNLGRKAIPIWNLHNLSSTPFLKFTNMGKISGLLDNTWNESNPSINSFTYMKMSSHKIPQNLLLTALLMSVMLTVIFMS